MFVSYKQELEMQAGMLISQDSLCNAPPATVERV